MVATTVVQFVLGIVLLIAGAEMLVRGASRLAAAFGVSSLVVGLTVVAFGTGSPELAVGIVEAAKRIAAFGAPVLACTPNRLVDFVEAPTSLRSSPR